MRRIFSYVELDNSGCSRRNFWIKFTISFLFLREIFESLSTRKNISIGNWSKISLKQAGFDSRTSWSSITTMVRQFTSFSLHKISSTISIGWEIYGNHDTFRLSSTCIFCAKANARDMNRFSSEEKCRQPSKENTLARKSFRSETPSRWEIWFILKSEMLIYMRIFYFK